MSSVPGALQLFEKLTGIDPTRSGKRSAAIAIPVRGHPAIRLPVTVVRRGEGPMVLFTGGNHGDEFEGPTALMKLARALELADLVRGGVIIMPAINPPALAAGRRTSPLDGKNLNRVFPGKARGSPTERIAHAISSAVLPHAVALLDLHAGGVGSAIMPSIMVHRFADPARMRATLAMMRAFRAPMGILIKEYDTAGMIDTTAERMGLLFGCCELGGMGTLTPETVAVTETGIRNVLKHFGIMRGPLETAAWRGRRSSAEAEAMSYRHYVKAGAAGIFEPFVDLGERVRAGEAVGQIHDPDRPARAPSVRKSRVAGILFARHAFGLIAKSDIVAIVARETKRW
jgi:N-alpha-acetyl-L-2,4-diaminobutyrate deacetylase